MDMNQARELCAWCGNEPGSDEHHIFRRSTSPAMINDPNNKVRLGRKCHHYATIYPEVEHLFQEVFFLRPDREELSYDFIAQQMVSKQVLTPRQIDIYRRYLAGYYAFISARYSELTLKQPFTWENLRTTVKSDKRASQLYSLTAEGQEEDKLRLQLKSMEKMMASLRGAHEQFQKESGFVF